MSVYKNTVSYYTKGIGSVVVSFLEDAVKCQWCEFLKNEQYANRNSCRLTGEKLPHIFEGIGMKCPLEFEEKEDESENK